ncbi:homoserine dehydrogenase [Halococcus saccharolyticus]|uniref:homoserine dehydrogenase n=1 Tax=Halococcus saccharolyticus DSM 5350 TaxID=1227455 RepID=M0MC97_9EURY|nr:homoserine dehydrogenase [Halococcus saccharolyticus]EMA43371.1 homoserine dehydrogenase [Halococcus saccharolyticus DSM 5350]
MKLAIVGCGAVGSAVAELAGEYGHRVTALADSTSATVDPDGIDVGTALDRKAEGRGVGTDGIDRALDAEYDALVEATPTTLGDAKPGFAHVRHALDRDAHAVLANKGPVAERYADLRAAERESEGEVLFEAAVGGAIPVLSTIADLGPTNVTAVRGVLNGTANFILSRMSAEGLDYGHVLAEAQDLGVAEADPTFDVEGTDAALKCVILANVLGDGETTLADANVTGITDLTPSALDLATDDGRTVRLVGEVVDGDGAPEVRVGPRLVPENGTLAVTGTQNIVQLETRHAGQLNLSGRGAGGRATATAVLGDVGRLP